MDSHHENLLKEFEVFEVNAILDEVKKWTIDDEDIREFGEALLEEKEAARPSSPSSTPHVRARALEPGLLPPTQHRVVHPGP